MQKEFKILFNFGLWFLLLFIVCLIGSSNVFALEYNDIGYVHTLSGVNGQVTIDVTYETESGAPLTINRNQVIYTQLKVMNVFISNYSFEANRQYQIEMEFPYQQLQYANTYQVFGSNNELCSLNYSNSLFNSQWPRWNWSCPHSTNEIYLKVYNSNNTAITSYGDWSWNYIYLRYTNTSIDTDITDTDSITNNANQNADRIINNNNENTQKIIDSNKENFQSCIDSINLANPNDFTLYKISLNNGIYSANDGDDASSLIMKIQQWSSLSSFLNVSGSQITKSVSSTGRISFTGTILQGANYIRIGNNGNTSEFRLFIPISSSFAVGDKFTLSFDIIDTTIGSIKLKNIQLEKGSIATEYEPYGEEICTNKLDETKDAINGLNDSLNDDDSSGATSEASDFFSSFTTNTFGLTSIITAPLNLIRSVLSSTCTTLQLPLPYLDNKKLELPCMSSIYSQYFGTFFTIYQTITYGIIAYWVCVRIFNQVKDFKNPDHDEIEVMDL